MSLIGRIARRLNWSRRRWSSDSDRAFHDELYAGDDYDPFSLAYPGYTTIRRFADLVEPFLPAQGTVVDFGCGPGEITCELAARRPDLTFFGIDHSAAAIAKARNNAARRGLANISFDAADVEGYVPAGRIDLATLFDSFHHLTQPAAFVARLGPHVARWALIEPRGSWLGTWQKDLDFDWVAQDLDKIRAHVAALCGETAPSSSSSSSADSRAGASAPAASHGEAVERRYTLDDLARFFDGYALDLRGTVAGLETYPPGAGLTGALRERFGELRYQLYKDIDDRLLARDLDLHAKHWLVVAERGGRSRQVNLSRIESPPERPHIAGPYDVRYGEYKGPRHAKPGERVVGTIQITNEGWNDWSSHAEPAVFTSYHWLDERGRIVAFDGERTKLPGTIGAGASCDAAIAFDAPDKPGRYRLAIDLVCEGVTWFSEAGRPWLEVPFEVNH